ncbi:MAG: 2-C-methyl-D-erythritol 4-phosphate cytidylyltransferase [Planctomycetales bacterium]|nr:2-C-methyl-D-erythritol 4-phosphate cytidylyltransferase [Planctomycetales bacterium]
MSKYAVILAAAGKSQRFGDPHKNKVFSTIDAKPLWMYAAEAFSKRADVAEIVLVISPDDREMFGEKFAGNAAILGVRAVVGGSSRAESVLNGLNALAANAPYVAVHDAARPCIAQPWIDAVFATAAERGAAILATPCHSTLKKVDGNRKIVETVPRDGLWLAQTPQVFKTDLLRRGYDAHPNPVQATDDAAIVAALGVEITVVEGSPLNVKVTTKSDLRFAELAMKALPKPKLFPFG